MVGDRALALILSLLPAPQGTSPAGWMERAVRLDGCDLEKLVLEIETAAPSDAGDADRSGERARAYVTATARLVGTPESGLCLEKDLVLRVERARQAALDHGSQADALNVENEYGKKLLLDGRIGEARQVLEAGRSRFPDARYLVFNLETAMLAAMLECAYTDAEREAEEEQKRLDALLPAEHDAFWRSILLESQATLLSRRATLAFRLGLLDQAALILDRQAPLLSELDKLDPTRAASVQWVFDRSNVDLGRQRFGAVLDRITAFDTRGLTREAAAKLELLRGMALCELAREGKVEPASVEPIFRSLCEASAPSAAVQDDAEYYLADLLAARGEFEEADQRLARLLARAAERPARRPCGAGETVTCALALRARIALLRGSPRSTLEALRVDLARRQEDALAVVRATEVRPDGIGHLHWGAQRFVIATLIDLELATKDRESGPEAALAHVLRAQGLGTFARTHALPPCDLADVRREMLLDGQGAIVLLPSWHDSHLFLIDRDEVRHFPLPSRDVLVAAGLEFDERARREPSADPDRERERRSERDAAGTRLRDLLFPSEALERIDGWSGMYVSGTELLGFPLLECLPWAHGRSLSEEKALANLPSIQVGVWLARRARERTAPRSLERLLVVGAPRTSAAVAAKHPELASFELSDASEEALSRSFASAEFLTGPAANADRLATELDGSTSVLEFFVHGVQDFDRARTSGLVLSPRGEQDDGVLWSEEIEGRISSPPLVGLFACSAALGRTRLGDDTSTLLGTSFFLCGADVVLISRTALEYRAMLALTEALHRELAVPGVSPAEALRRARVELIARSADRDALPYGRVTLLGLGLAPFSSAAPGPMPQDGRWSLFAKVAVPAIAISCLTFAWLGRRRLRRASSPTS